MKKINPEVKPHLGLSKTKAIALLKVEGPNELPATNKRDLFGIA